jgi:hypothetical protein
MSDAYRLTILRRLCASALSDLLVFHILKLVHAHFVLFYTHAQSRCPRGVSEIRDAVLAETLVHKAFRETLSLRVFPLPVGGLYL